MLTYAEAEQRVPFAHIAAPRGAAAGTSLWCAVGCTLTGLVIATDREVYSVLEAERFS
jgi:hypothetical protein